jgi:hypothetical protein
MIMENKENPPVKPRKLKKMDEYREKLLPAWRFYQREIEKGTDPRKAELQAVKRVYPGDKNSSTTLSVWKKYKLWPVTEEILNSGIFGEQDSRNQGRNGLSVISGGGTKKPRKLKDPSENGYLESDLSEKEILRGMRKILDTIEVHHREWTGGRLKKYSMIKTKLIAGRMPVDLINEIHRFKGTDTYHLERALRLYALVMKETA